MNDVLACEAVAEAWNRAGIRYSPVHGLEAYPRRMGRDLDVLVAGSQVEYAAAIARGVLERFFEHVVRPPPIWGERLIGVTDTAGELEVLEVHLTDEIRWRHIVLATDPRERDRIGPFTLDPWAAFAKRVVLPLLAGGGEPFGATSDRLPVTGPEATAARDRLPDLTGAGLAERLVRAVARGDREALGRLAPVLRRAASRRAWRKHPIRSVARLVSSARRRVALPFKPCAPVVALVGPDGIGKSSLIAALRDGDRLLFTDVCTRHWRPGLLPPLSALAGRRHAAGDAGPGGPPRRTPGHFQTLRLAYYALDYLLGTYLKDRLDTSRQRLVVYDRCLLDMAVDPGRYGLRSARGVHLLWRFLPRPDCVIVLSDDARTIHSRKSEIPVEEIDRQLTSWRAFTAADEVGPVLRVDDTPRVLAGRLMSIVMSTLVEMNTQNPVETPAPGSLPA